MSIQTPPHKDRNFERLIAYVLRFGVTLACFFALIGGSIYLFHHGGEAMPDYSAFSYKNLPEGFEQYTTLSGIFAGLRAGTGIGWIMLGVVTLLLTPIARILLSLIDFLYHRDWLYVGITLCVLATIIGFSVMGR